LADQSNRRRQPRIRKSPTFAEQAQAERAKAQKEKPRRLGGVGAALKRPFTETRLPSSPATRVLAKIGRGLKRLLSWLVPRYFINSWREVRLVTWPNRRETWRLTGAVFIFVVVFGALVALVDKGLDEIFKKVILK
jgi:preprotein translocase SecE subunit